MQMTADGMKTAAQDARQHLAETVLSTSHRASTTLLEAGHTMAGAAADVGHKVSGTAAGARAKARRSRAANRLEGIRARITPKRRKASKWSRAKDGMLSALTPLAAAVAAVVTTLTVRHATRSRR